MSIEQHIITDRDMWLKLREQDVTASAAGALFGVHSYLTPLRLYLLKTGQVVDEDNKSMRRGRMLEPIALQIIQEERPDWGLMPNTGKIYYRDPEARIGATPDSQWHCPERGHGIVQIKSVLPYAFKESWLDDRGQIEPPLWIGIQAYIEAVLTGAKWAAVAPMRIGVGIDIDIIEIPLDVQIMDVLKERCAEFWQRVADRNPPPADYGSDGELIKRLYRDEADPVDLTSHNRIAELCEEYERWQTRARQADGALEFVKNEVRDILRGAPVAQHPAWNITNRTVKTKEYTVAASSYRNLRITRKKSTGKTDEE